MRLQSMAVCALVIAAGLALEACAPVRPRDGWQGQGRRWFDAEVLTGFDDDGRTVATLAVSIPYRNLVFFTGDEGYEASYSVDVVQRRDGESMRSNRFTGEVLVDSYAGTREALVERKTVRLELIDVTEKGSPLELLVSVQVGGTRRANRMLLTVTPQQMSEGGLALGEITMYRLRDPLRLPPETTLQIAARAVPDPELFARSVSGGFDVATGAPWMLVRVFDLSPSQGEGEHPLLLEVTGTDGDDHVWTQPLRVPKQGVETAVLLQIPATALTYGTNRLSVSLPEAKRRSIDVDNFGLDFTEDRSWKSAVRQVELLAESDELKQLKKAAPEDRAAVWRDFWDRRNPDLSDPENSRLREHYRRVAYSRRNYADGMRDGALSDRGRVFVLHGPPESVQSSSGEFDARSSWEVWSYSELGLVYYFQLVYGSNYRLVWREQV